MFDTLHQTYKRIIGSKEMPMDDHLFVATTTGLAICQHRDGDWHETDRGLRHQNVTSVIAREGVILAGTTDGVYFSDDLGRNWRSVSVGLTHRHVRWLAYDPAISDAEFVGTEPAGIFVSRDGAETWQPCPEVAALRDANDWFLPYSPEAGCVRGFAFHGQRVYAAVEVGGLLCSNDGGNTWDLVMGSDGDPDFSRPVPLNSVHPDVHSVAVHPTSPDLVFAPTGGGFYASKDGGKSWVCLYPHCYCRAVWLNPDNPNHLIIGPADFVDRNGRIEESHDGGQNWTLASIGLDIPWPRHMVERFVHIGDNLFAVLSNGQLIVTPPDNLEWQRILPGLSNIAAVASMG
jgi:photosystem II stability/assembly factor-like uncharacterized protein